jgi:lipopolysaccharide biosynthesis regulator YciM
MGCCQGVVYTGQEAKQRFSPLHFFCELPLSKLHQQFEIN